MDALARLQSVQATLRLMRDHSLSACEPSNSLSDRFLADFFLFLIQSCADAEELGKRCDIMIKQLPKVSTTFLRALVAENSAIGGVEEENARLSSKIMPAENIHESRPQNDVTRSITVSEERGPLVGLKAMQRANSTMEDFCRSYFMFHGMDAHNPQHVFKYLPILSFVEATIYQLDEENEDQLSVPSRAAYRLAEDPRDGSEDNRSDHTAKIKAIYVTDKLDTTASLCSSVLESDPFGRLRHVLAAHGLLTDRIELELKNGVEYWRLERNLCESVMKGNRISVEDVLKAIKLKSFDYRVLNLLLYSLTGREVDRVHFDFLAVSELLVEISDDLFDYEDDVLKNSFNVLRMLVKIKGPTEAPEILAKLISEEELRYQTLLAGLDPQLASHYQDRCKEATNEGSYILTQHDPSKVHNIFAFSKSVYMVTGKACACCGCLSKSSPYVVEPEAL